MQIQQVVVTYSARREGPGKDGAAMRKLLQLVYGILKSGQPFDPNYSANIQVTA